MAEPVRYLLDTSALLAHFRQEGGWSEVQALFEDDNAELLLASISLTEFGRRLGEFGADPDEVDGVLSSYQLLFREVVSVDVVIARAAYHLGCMTPQRLPLADALIAATAQIKKAVLVHRDAHMQAVPHDLVHQLALSI